MEIVIYGAPNCSACNRAKQICEDRDLVYTYCDATQSENYDWLTMYFKGAGEPMPRQVPMVFVDYKYIGNANDLEVFCNEII